MNNISRLQAWVTYHNAASQNPSLGVLPPDSLVLRAYIEVVDGFDSDGTDNIQCGYDADQDFIFANVDAASAGFTEPTLGAAGGYNATAREIEAYYTFSGSSPTQGSAFVVVEFMRIPPKP